MNSVILIGRLTRDPEVRYTSSQMAVCHFTIAVDRPRSQNRDQSADFLRITVFGKQAENCGRYLAKGRQVGVQGRIQTGSYKNRDGQTIYTTDVIANSVEFLGGGQNGAGRDGDKSNFAGSNDGFGYSMPDDMDLPEEFETTEDDIPF